MKTLKECGDPFGARMVFRLQWLPLITMILLFMLTIPAILVWGLVHHSGVDFFEEVLQVIQDKGTEVKDHRDRLVRMYAS